MPPADQIAALKTLYPRLSAAEEGGLPYLRIEELKLPAGASPAIVTGLLCPALRDGYQSRLFLDQKISHSGRGTNWNPVEGVVILGHRWYAVSWQTKAGQSLIQMMLDHLGAFTK